MSSLRDNYTRGNLGDFLKDKIKTDARLSFVSAFFTIYAYDKLRAQLDSIGGLRFLFGEPSFLLNVDPEKNQAKSFVLDDSRIELANRLEQKEVARACADWIRTKAEIRSVKHKGFLHGKMYHIERNGLEDAILGSSNFTASGLGLGARPNIELNLEVNDRRDREDLKQWFEEIWNNSDLVEDVKTEILAYLEQLYVDNSPEFIYFKTLFHIFEKFLAEQTDKDLIDERVRLYDTQVWNILYDFQKHGAKGAVNKILRHNGCILADSVGLGKTFTGLAVIKYFELLNYRVLVLCPKRLRENWTVYQAANNSELNPFLGDKFGYTVLSHTDLSREEGRVGDINLENFNWGNFDLVVIDESHNFRNNTKGKRDEQGVVVRKSRYERLLDDIIRSGVKTRVLLLSATPVNNQLRDLRNQINFLTGNNFSAFGETLRIPDYAETLRVAQGQFSLWAKGDHRDARQLLERLDSELFTLLDELTIARSRKHIKKYYDITKIGPFPERAKPISVFPTIDNLGQFMSYDDLNEEVMKYKLSLFSPSFYLKPEFKKDYEGKIKEFKQEDREHFLIGMMKVNFMKRLESSICSFRISMENTVAKIEDLETKILEYKAFKAGEEYDTDDYKVRDPDDPELEDAFQVGKKVTFPLAHLDVDRWLVDLEKDKQQLTKLRDSAKEVDSLRDAKMAELKKMIEGKVKNPTTNLMGKLNRKMLVFTAFADTAVYLYNNLKELARNQLGIHIALVTGGSTENRTTFGRRDYTNILTNFSPVAKERAKLRSMPQDGEIEILIATDCISEGQNLQDCDYLINYDIHWNPVRIIQRFGRIDRLGSRNKSVQMVNFWPTKELEKYIKLKARVEAKMALVDLTATAEENILNEDEIRDLINQDLKYRDKQLLRLKDEVLDIEDVAEGISLGEFSLDDFRAELSNYIEANREKLQNAPFGMYTVVPAYSDLLSKIPPGVIFCLKQKGNTAQNEKVNPVQPYFLVYVQRDGEVRVGFVQTKLLLEIYRFLCSGKKEAYEELCRAFDSETNQGRSMGQYTAVLERAVSSIRATFRKRMVQNLLRGRDGRIIDQDQQPKAQDDFELVSWLVIM
jgi:superfamily II DNA or RNA helicase